MKTTGKVFTLSYLAHEGPFFELTGFQITCCNCGSQDVRYKLVAHPYYDDGCKFVCGECGQFETA
jgi:hypothetical protein